MTEIHVIDLLDATHNGPTAIGPSGEEQEVHLQQGSLDGACGPYSLLMCLLICGLIERSAIINSYYSKQTSIGKILERIKQGKGLFKDGTDLEELKKFIEGTFPKKLEIETIEKSGVDVRSFVEKHINQNHPVIMGMEYPGSGHWVVAIGLEYSRESNGTLTLCRTLVLDPDKRYSKVSAWNGVVDARGSGGPYPYTWWTSDDKKVKLDQAMAMWRK